jgi:hypothetical protein
MRIVAESLCRQIVDARRESSRSYASLSAGLMGPEGRAEGLLD